jgi:WbqC-like protein
MTTIAIHQPNFFPWLGYFDKIARSDVFVFLDHVQFPKTGGVWCNRVKLLLGGEARWVTAPVTRNFHGVRAIAEVEFEPANPWRAKFLKSLAASYGRAPFFQATMDVLEPMILNQENNLARYNAAAVIGIASFLGQANEKFHWSSKMPVDGQGSDMLISLTRATAGDAYLCGGGATGYQDDASFAAAGIHLAYQDFQHPVYPQVGARTFVTGLSVIDALMNVGIEEVRALLHII